MARDLIFPKAHVHVIKHTLKSAKVTSWLEMRATLTPELAGILGVKWMLFDKNYEQRVGYSGVDLDVLLIDFGFTLQPEGLGVLKFSSSQAKDFRVEKKKEGKGKKLMVTFKVLYTGAVAELVGWWEINGEVDGPLTLRAKAEQGDLFAPPPEEKKAGKRGRPLAQASFQEAAAGTAAKVADKKATPGPKRVQ